MADPGAADDPFQGKLLIAETRLLRWERRLRLAILAALSLLQDQVLADVRHLTAAFTWADPLDEAAWDTVLAAEVRPVVNGLVTEIGATMLTATPDLLALYGQWDADSQVRRLMDRVADIGPVTALDLGATLQEGWAAGEKVDRLVTRVQDVFESSEVRARRIARTETLSAANEAGQDNADVFERAGSTVEKTWLATFDRRTRPTHAEAHGQTVANDQPFIVGGAELLFPGDPDGPAEEVINCRCTTTYEILD